MRTQKQQNTLAALFSAWIVSIYFLTFEITNLCLKLIN